ncbi:MAG: hypothetical protein KC912_26035 [Proteobacteria bacterium]|nr:hypothetical protein [Pseudomonadota bacterium]
MSFVTGLVLLSQIALADEPVTPAGATAVPEATEATPTLVPDRELTEYASAPVDPASGKFKPGKGLQWSSADGRHSLALGFRAMFLYELEHDPTAVDPDPNLTQQVMIRRARITAVGTMWGEHNKYKIELAISPRDESVNSDGLLRQTPLLTWENTFTHVRDANLRVGQYKVPYSRERVISSSKLSMVDRSGANSTFNLDRDIGLDVGSKDLGGLGLFQYNVGVYAGEGRGRFEANNLGMMYLARVNVTPFGLFDDYEAQDFKRTGLRLSMGAAYAYVDSPAAGKDITDGEADYAYHNVTADALLKVKGFSTETAFFWRDGADTDQDLAEVGTGFYVQPQMLIPHTPIGVATRYGKNFPEAKSALSERTEVGGGVSYYLSGARNKMKFQADYLRTWGDDPSEGEDQGRVQLQCMF